jgi:hypothetical protein
MFEHIEDPEWLARELLRIVKPRGLITAFTPNKFGYFAVAARMVPNRLHVGALSKIQPGRKAEDVFPTHYRLNTAAAAEGVRGARPCVCQLRVVGAGVPLRKATRLPGGQVAQQTPAQLTAAGDSGVHLASTSAAVNRPGKTLRPGLHPSRNPTAQGSELCWASSGRTVSSPRCGRREYGWAE